MDNQKETLIKDAQYRKGMSIAYFNSLNAAINLVTAQGTRFASEEAMLEMIEKYKNVFISNHDDYYRNTLVNVRAPYNALDTVKKLKATKTLEDLQTVWTNLSEDERRNPEIVKAKDAMKAKLAPKEPKVVPPSVNTTAA